MSILSDINARLPEVNSSDIMSIYDTDVVKQNLIGLVHTEVNEIWNYRAYGLNLKQFLFHPLTDSTAREIERYILGQIARFEPNVTYIDLASQIIFDYNNNALHFKLTYQLNASGDLIVIPVLSVSVNQ